MNVSTPPSCGILKEDTPVPAEHGQAPQPPAPPALSRDSRLAVTCSGQQPQVQPEHSQSGKFLGQDSEPALHTPNGAWTATGAQPHDPSPPPPYQGSGQDKELPCLSPKAHGDQPEEGTATAPLVQGNCVLETVHSKPPAFWLPAHLSTPTGSLGWPQPELPSALANE